MAKRTINKILFQALSVLYYGLCLSGLTWQVTEISVRFFSFGVSRTTLFILPEDLRTGEKVLYACFNRHEIFGMSARLHWDMEVGEIFPRLPTNEKMAPSKISNQFIVDDKTCLQFSKFAVFKKFANISTIFLSYSSPLPRFDYDRMERVKITEFEDVTFGVSSTAFIVKKLKYPYEEMCVNYVGRYPSRTLAIDDCVSKLLLEYSGGRRLYKKTVVTREEYPVFANLTIWGSDAGFGKECSRRIIFPDCFQTIFISKVMQETGIGLPGVVPVQETDPSFIIYSRPSIDMIDFVTYIFGAFGAWLGVSMAMLNPVPLFSEPKTSTSNTVVAINHEHCTCHAQHTAVTNALKQRSLQDRDNLSVAITKLDQLSEAFENFKNDNK